MYHKIENREHYRKVGTCIGDSYQNLKFNNTEARVSQNGSIGNDVCPQQKFSYEQNKKNKISHYKTSALPFSFFYKKKPEKK